MDINEKANKHQKKRSSLNALIPAGFFLVTNLLGGCAVAPAQKQNLELEYAQEPVVDSVVPELAPYGPDYEHLKAKQEKEKAKQEKELLEIAKREDERLKRLFFLYGSANNTGVLAKAGKKSIESVNGHLLNSSSGEGGFSLGIGVGYVYEPFDFHDISPRISFSYEISRGINFKEDILTNDGVRIMGDRELMGQGVRFGGGFDIPFGQNKAWLWNIEVGGAYMKNTVDLSVKATYNGEEIGSVEKSASKTTLNPYGQVGVMFDWFAWRKSVDKRNARWLAGAGVRAEKTTIVDPNQGESSDTKTSVYLDFNYKF